MSNVEKIAAALNVALKKIGATIAGLRTADKALEEAAQALAQATQGSTASELVQAKGHVVTARQGIATQTSILNAAVRSLDAYRTSLRGTGIDGRSIPADPGPDSPGGYTPPDEPAARTSDQPSPEPEHVRAARAELPPPVVANAGKKTHGRWTTGDQAADAVPIVSGRKDDMYQVTQAHLASVGMGHYAIASHVETKLAVHMAQTGLTDVTAPLKTAHRLSTPTQEAPSDRGVVPGPHGDPGDRHHPG